MTGEPFFRSTDEALQVTWYVISQLCRLIAWVVIALAHLALLWLLALVAWWHHLTPEATAAFGQQLLQSTTAAALGAAGLSGATLLAAWAWLMRQLHRQCAQYAGRLLLRGVAKP